MANLVDGCFMCVTRDDTAFRALEDELRHNMQQLGDALERHKVRPWPEHALSARTCSKWAPRKQAPPPRPTPVH